MEFQAVFETQNNDSLKKKQDMQIHKLRPMTIPLTFTRMTLIKHTEKALALALTLGAHSLTHQS